MKTKIICFSFIIFLASNLFAASFQGIGVPPTKSMSVGGISSDKILVSYSDVKNWTWSAGSYTITDFPGKVMNISDDSSTIIGYIPVGNSFYTVTNGTTNVIAGPVPGLLYTTPSAVSANGSKIVGNTRGTGSQQTPSWIYENGNFTLLPLPNGAQGTHGIKISADGSVVAGTVYGNDNSVRGHIVLWENNNITVLPNPEGEFFTSCEISGDSSTLIAGHYRWHNGTIDTIPILEGFTSSYALALSFDGSLVFGYASNGTDNIAFIWDPINGTRTLKDFLQKDYGLNLTGWTLQSVSATDTSGNIITGYGLNPQGQRELWIATIPEPATIFMFSLGLLIIKKRAMK